MTVQNTSPCSQKPYHAPFNSDEWLFEIKWDGVRAIAYVYDTVSLKSRNNHELIGQFPELNELLHLAPGTVLDGEIVVDERGKTRYTIPASPVAPGKRKNTFLTNPSFLSPISCSIS